jgi:hypothetical protein
MLQYFYAKYFDKSFRIPSHICNYFHIITNIALNSDFNDNFPVLRLLESGNGIPIAKNRGAILITGLIFGCGKLT